MTTGYNIACALHPSLVSIPFYAIPISLSTIYRNFYLLVSSIFFAAFSKNVDTIVVLKALAHSYKTSSNAVLIAIGARKTARGIINCNPIHHCISLAEVDVYL